MVIPDKDMVISITADTGNMQGELNAICDNPYPAFQAERSKPKHDRLMPPHGEIIPNR